MNKNNEIRQQNKLPGIRYPLMNTLHNKTPNVDEPHGAEEIAKKIKRAERFGEPTPVQKQCVARSSTSKKEGSNNKRKAQKTSIYRIRYNGGFEYKESEPVQKKRRVAHFSTGAGASCTPVEPCRNYRRGCCKRGDKCTYLHEYGTVHDGMGHKIILKNKTSNSSEKNTNSNKKGSSGLARMGVHGSYVMHGTAIGSSTDTTSCNDTKICVKCEQIPATRGCTAVNGRQCGICCNGCAKHPQNNEELEVVQKRMDGASAEITHWAEYDYVVINEDLNQSVNAVLGILKAERMKRTRQEGLVEFVRSITHDF